MIDELVKKLTNYSNKYYEGNQEVSDEEYDALEDQLRQLDPQNDYFKRNREASASGYGVQYPHKYSFIGSVDKIHQIEESKLLKKAKMVSLSAKLDGTSMVAYYTNGFLDYALTRCDGYKGFDVTQHYLKITKKYDLKIPYDFTGAIRGEVVFTKENWETFHLRHPEAKFPRNSGTGLVNGKQVSEDEQLLSFVAYDFPGTSYQINDADIFTRLQLFGFETAPHLKVNIEKANSSHIDITSDYLRDIFDNWGQIYPLDGIVIRRIDNIRNSSELNADNVYVPSKEQEAFKFAAETKECKVTNVTWQLGRTGKLTPVIQIEPTELSGAVVTNVTGHNAKNILDNGIDKDAIIMVRRSGEVIPYLADIVKGVTTHLPSECPCCGYPLIWTDTNVDLVCTNEDCDGLFYKSLSNYILCFCDDIKGLGDAFLEGFIGFFNPISIPAFITLMNDCKDDLIIPTLGNADNKIAKQVISKFREKEVDPIKFFKALGIKFLGTSFAQELGKSIHLKSLLTAIEKNDEDMVYNIVMEALPGRLAVATSISSRTNKIKDILDVMNNYQQYIKLPDLEKISQGQMHLYAVTGSVSKSRKEFEQELLKKGWQLTSNISKCEVLINNDTESNSSKNVKAKAANKPIISEAEFREKYLK